MWTLMRTSEPSSTPTQVKPATALLALQQKAPLMAGGRGQEGYSHSKAEELHQSLLCLKHFVKGHRV